MTKGKKYKNKIWIIILILSLLFLLWTVPLLLLSGGSDIVERGLKLAGSTFQVAELDPAAQGFFNMSMLKPVWEELWIGIIGIYLALTLRQEKHHAWWLGFFWGIMLITNAAIQGFYEVLILRWSSACLQTYFFLILGIIAVSSLLITRKSYISQSVLYRSK